MALGPGKYDENASRVREETKAAGVVLAVLGGRQGDGFSVQGTVTVLAALPRILRMMADTIEKDSPGFMPTPETQT